MIYAIKITSPVCDPIEIGRDEVEEEKGHITNVNIRFDTVDNDVEQKSNAILAKVEIVGKIDEGIKKELLAMFNWAKDLEQDKWYRTLEIRVKPDDKKVSRTYKFENMFVVDYFELHSSDGNKSTPDGLFELHLTQKKDNLKLIDSWI